LYIKQLNAGPSSARNTGIRASVSEYIAFLDCDDVWKPQKLEKQLALFQKSQSKRLGIVYCNTAGPEWCGRTRESPGTQPLSARDRGSIFKRLVDSNIAGSGSAVVAKRECFEVVGLFDENLRLCEDWDMWLRISERYEFDYVDEPLVKIRLHRWNASRDTDGMITGRIRVLSKLLKSHPGNPFVLQELRYQVLRLTIQRRTRVRRNELRQYLDEDTLDHLFFDVFGVARALGKGLAKAARRTGACQSG
jgi:glycosyltransferase involved in cell wall biosynthesis